MSLTTRTDGSLAQQIPPDLDAERSRTIVEDGYRFEIANGGFSDVNLDSSTDGITDYVIRSLVHMQGTGSQTDFFFGDFFAGIGGRRGGEPLNVEQGGISAAISAKGNLLLTWIDADYNLEILANVETGIDPIDTDVFLQFDMLGDHFDITAWEFGQQKPAAQISMEAVKPKLAGTLALLLFAGRESDALIFKSFESRPPGDVDGNFVTDLEDLELISREIRSPGSFADTSWMDVNSDGVISELDRTYWITEISNVPEPPDFALIIASGLPIALRLRRSICN